MVAVPLGETDRLSGSLSEEIKLSTSGFSTSSWYYFNNIGAVQWKDSLYTLVVYNSSDSEVFVYTMAFSGNHRPGKDLYAFFVSFLYFAVYLDSIAHLEARYLLFKILTLNCFQKFRFH